MTERQTEPAGVVTVELRRVANGWMVLEGGAYSLSRDRVTGPENTWVFRTWDECAAFLRRITE